MTFELSLIKRLIWNMHSRMRFCLWVIFSSLGNEPNSDAHFFNSSALASSSSLNPGAFPFGDAIFYTRSYVDLLNSLKNGGSPKGGKYEAPAFRSKYGSFRIAEEGKEGNSTKCKNSQVLQECDCTRSSCSFSLFFFLSYFWVFFLLSTISG